MCSFILKQHRNERYVSCDWFTRCFKSMRSSLMMEVTHRLSENTTEEEIRHDEDSGLKDNWTWTWTHTSLSWIMWLGLMDTSSAAQGHMSLEVLSSYGLPPGPRVGGGGRALVLVFLQLFMQQQQQREGILSPNIHVFRMKSGLEFMLSCKIVANDSDWESFQDEWRENGSVSWNEITFFMMIKQMKDYKFS